MSLSYTLEHLDEAIDRSAMVAPEIDPKRTALLMLDPQRLIMEPEGAAFVESVGGAPSGEDVIEPCERVLERCRAEGIPVMWSLWGLRPDGLDAGMAALKWPPLTPGEPDSPTSWGHVDTEELGGSLEPREGEPVIRKPRFSTFYDTPFDEYLRQLGIEYLVIAGVTSANCAHATAMDGSNRNYKVIVLADCTTAVPSSHTTDVPEGYGQHWEALRNIQMNYGDVLTSAEFFDKLETAKSGAVASGA